MSLIQATSRGVKGTLSDGTVRFLIEVEPQHANDAFALFGMPGSPVVIARLTQKASIASQQAETVAGHTDARVSEEKPKGGDLARLAGQFCANPMFREWMGAKTADEAAKTIRYACNVSSRAELDHDEVAAAEFHRIYRLPFRDYCREMGVA